MKVFSFALILSGSAADTDDFADALYGDGHDCTISASQGVVKAGFDREAKNLRDAILSAIRSVHSADRTVAVTGILTEGEPIDGAFAA